MIGNNIMNKNLWLNLILYTQYWDKKNLNNGKVIIEYPRNNLKKELRKISLQTRARHEQFIT